MGVGALSARKNRILTGIVLAVLGVVGLLVAVQENIQIRQRAFEFAGFREATSGSSLEVLRAIMYGAGAAGIALLISGIVLLATLKRARS